RRDVARIQAGLDLATSSSVSEAFPLCLGEAMACGVPCVATDVGDSAAILGGTGQVVPPHAPAALAGAWEELLDLEPDDRTRLGRWATHAADLRAGPRSRPLGGPLREPPCRCASCERKPARKP